MGRRGRARRMKRSSRWPAAAANAGRLEDNTARAMGEHDMNAMKRQSQTHRVKVV